VTASTLQSEIWSAFSDAPRPAQDDIIQHACEECFFLRDAFAPYTASALPFNTIEGHFADLSLLSPAAFRHYLPAYLCRALDRPDSDVFQFTLYHLSPEKLTDQYWIVRLASFSQPEKVAIRAFLEHIKQTDTYNFYREEIDAALIVWSPDA
jgi:hypothetical protein